MLGRDSRRYNLVLHPAPICSFVSLPDQAISESRLLHRGASSDQNNEPSITNQNQPVLPLVAESKRREGGERKRREGG